MDRYTPLPNSMRDGTAWHNDPEGDWVKYEDAQKELEAKDKLIEELKKYAGHKEECESTYQTLDGVVELDFGCTCGLDDLLKEK